MAKTVLVVAPHPDDETLGCGGTLIKHLGAGDQVYWCIFTDMRASPNYCPEQCQCREKTIERVSSGYGFTAVLNLGFPPAGLDQIPQQSLISKFNQVIESIKPDTIYVPFVYDIHSDHRITAETVLSATKPFRAPYIKRLISYETLSETDLNPSPNSIQFKPNYYVDIEKTAEKKYQLLDHYRTEFGEHPFPRSLSTIKALEMVRGAQANLLKAEAFIILREIN
jgi:LmbE family N-acetylglucosaminyl deacetylase